MVQWFILKKFKLSTNLGKNMFMIQLKIILKIMKNFGLLTKFTMRLINFARNIPYKRFILIFLISLMSNLFYH